MIFGIVVGMLSLLPVGILALIIRQQTATRPVGVVLGVFAGAAAGAGILLGAIYQPTTANIHSGYSFAGVFEFLVLAFGGGVLGGAVGGAIGWRVMKGRRALAVLVAFAIVGAAGWVVSSSRTTIDCDERESYCEDRYD